MAAGNVTRTIRGSGRLVVGPTDLSVDFPYGGTEIGKTRDVVLTPVGTNYRVHDELAGEACDILESTHQWLFAFAVRAWDADAVRLFLSDGYSEGAVSQHAVWSFPGTREPGASALSRAVSVLHVPDDVTHNPAVLIYRGVPIWAEDSDMAFQRGTEFALPIVLDCFRDANNRVGQVGRLVDLSLT